MRRVRVCFSLGSREFGRTENRGGGVIMRNITKNVQGEGKGRRGEGYWQKSRWTY